jgi:hypothetical protein
MREKGSAGGVGLAVGDVGPIAVSVGSAGISLARVEVEEGTEGSARSGRGVGLGATVGGAGEFTTAVVLSETASIDAD